MVATERREFRIHSVSEQTLSLFPRTRRIACSFADLRSANIYSHRRSYPKMQVGRCRNPKNRWDKSRMSLVARRRLDNHNTDKNTSRTSGYTLDRAEVTLNAALFSTI